jgi:ABC-type glutathione transport system ATPase component
MNMVNASGIKKYYRMNQGVFKARAGMVKAVDGVCLKIEKGCVFGLVGESGSGKTTLGKIILGVVKPDSGTLEIGSGKAQIIFQDPYNSLDPKMKIFDILAEGLIIKGQRDGLRKRLDNIVDLVRLPMSALGRYPHQFSGGERQRIAIARALLTEPELVVCDEPVSSLDVMVQLDILNLLKSVQKRFGITYLFISHDLRVVRYMCDRVAVMKEGRIVEEGKTEEIYTAPRVDYTKKLISSILRVYQT